jgi:hypothetical protein
MMLELIVSVLTGTLLLKALSFQKKKERHVFFVFPSFLIRLCAVFRRRPDGVAAHLGKADSEKL